MYSGLLIANSGRRKNLRNIVGFDTLSARFELIGFPVGDGFALVLLDVVRMHELAGHQVMGVCSSFSVKVNCTSPFTMAILPSIPQVMQITSSVWAGEVEVLAVAVRADALLTLPQLGLVILLIIRRIFYFHKYLQSLNHVASYLTALLNLLILHDDVLGPCEFLVVDDGPAAGQGQDGVVIFDGCRPVGTADADKGDASVIRRRGSTSFALPVGSLAAIW